MGSIYSSSGKPFMMIHREISYHIISLHRNWTSQTRQNQNITEPTSRIRAPLGAHAKSHPLSTTLAAGLRLPFKTTSSSSAGIHPCIHTGDSAHLWNATYQPPPPWIPLFHHHATWGMWIHLLGRSIHPFHLMIHILHQTVSELLTKVPNFIFYLESFQRHSSFCI